VKVFLLLSAIPYDKGEAIEVVSHEVVRLMAAGGHEIYVQALIRESRSDTSDQRQRYAARQFSNDNRVRLLEPIYLGDLVRSRSAAATRWQHVSSLVRSLPGLRRQINAYFFPAVVAKPLVEARVRETGADIIASIWSWEALAASYAIADVPKFVYYGNPNHKPVEAQLAFPDLFELSNGGLVDRLKLRGLKLLNRAREIQHVKMMAACEVTSNNALMDAEYYTAMGHPRSLYLQNMWPDAPEEPVFGGPEGDGPARICGSVGNLGATGNTFGLYYLGTELAPRLEGRLGRDEVVIDVYGGGKARRPVAKALQHPSIRLRGWVDNLNAEIIASSVFLVLTNVYGFNVGNTRILLAWSLGACVIAHSSSALSMPELVHDETALLGDTPDEIAELVTRAVRDRGLRERIGRGGYRAFRQYYRSETLVPRMLAEIERAVREFRDGTLPTC
jgi:hypothetical protein